MPSVDLNGWVKAQNPGAAAESTFPVADLKEGVVVCGPSQRLDVNQTAREFQEQLAILRRTTPEKVAQGGEVTSAEAEILLRTPPLLKVERCVAEAKSLTQEQRNDLAEKYLREKAGK